MGFLRWIYLFFWNADREVILVLSFGVIAILVFRLGTGKGRAEELPAPEPDDAIVQAEPIVLPVAVEPASATIEQTGQVKLDAVMGQPVVLAGQSHTGYLKVGLTGFSLEDERQRPPVNVGFVIDRSGSMSGDKLEEAKQAAIAGVEQLRDDDIVSVITYDDVVTTWVSPTRARNKTEICDAIRRITPGGDTALFAGVAKGAAAVDRFFDPNQVNRLILLSDGQANVGPSSPPELEELGRSLAADGVTVSTVGLGMGYNEELMVRLAQGGIGNHYFVDEPAMLAEIFTRELGRMSSVVAQQVQVQIDCAEGVQPVRVLGRPATIVGTRVTVDLHQLYEDFENYLVLEVELPPTAAGSQRTVSQVTVSYRNLTSDTVEHVAQTVQVRGSRHDWEVEAAVDNDAMVAVTEYISTENTREALALMRSRRFDEADELLRRNIEYLEDAAEEYDSERLDFWKQENLGWTVDEQKKGRYGLDKVEKDMEEKTYMYLENNYY